MGKECWRKGEGYNGAERRKMRNKRIRLEETEEIISPL
jgi:hypothetical protein